MKIICVICQDVLILSDTEDIVFTHCGHVFHYYCLLHWLDRSETCPQCRAGTTKDRIHKAHFTFSNTKTRIPTAVDNVDNLSSQSCEGLDSIELMKGRIDSLNFQILLNERNIKHYTLKNKILEKQNAGLRQEVRKVESEISKKNSTIYDLKEQIKNYEEKHKVLKKELRQKERRNMEYCRDRYRKLSIGSLEDVRKMVRKITNRNTLIYYISNMKARILKQMERIDNLQN